MQFYEQGPQRTLDHLEQFFIRQQKVGYFSNVDPYFLAEQFISALRGEKVFKLQLGLGSTPDEAQIDSWARQATRLFLHGCLSNGQDSSASD
jgi:TetR/AcrR family transcriptional repressor of mexJK operon